MTEKPFRIEQFTATDTGLVRSANEDSHLALPDAGVWIVADGMGGHANGRMASQAIVEAAAGLVAAASLEEGCEHLAQAIHRANGLVYAHSQELGQQMGSTMVALLVHGREFSVMWAGDSRAYLLRDGQLIPLTRDHTQVEFMVERGIISPEDARDHPMKHVLARAVGVQESLEIDAIRDEVEPGDLFLLCSDGLHGLVEDHEIEVLLRDDGAGAGQRLIGLCLERGAPDNVTVALVAAHEPTLLSLEGEMA